MYFGHCDHSHLSTSFPRGETIVALIIVHLHSVGFFPVAAAIATTTFSSTMLLIALYHQLYSRILKAAGIPLSGRMAKAIESLNTENIGRYVILLHASVVGNNSNGYTMHTSPKHRS